MREEPESLKTPEIDRKEIPGSPESVDRQRINQIADEMAGKGKRTQQEYDHQHDNIPATGPGGIS